MKDRNAYVYASRYPRDRTCQWGSCEKPISDLIDVSLCDYHAIRVYRRVAEAIKTLKPEFVSEFFALGATEPKPDGVVYFVEFGDRIKIGFSRSLKKRMQVVPHDRILATMPGTFETEGQMHARFAADRITGEWFHRSPALMGFIQELAAA